MSWRVAKSLLALRAQVNTMAPNRSKASDGSIGDSAHASTGSSSDHNPWVHDSAGQPVVTAIDITLDAAHGCDVVAIAEAIIASRDHRVKYMIHNGRIVGDYSVGSTPAWVWRNRGLSNDHVHHLHISVDSSQSAFDGVGAWAIKASSAPRPTTKPVSKPTLAARANVKALQTAVHVSSDGAWGPGSDRALNAVRYYATGQRTPWGARTLQQAAGTKVDNIIGPNTQAAVRGTVAAIQKALGGLATDGIWGSKTEAAFQVARRAYFMKY